MIPSDCICSPQARDLAIACCCYMMGQPYVEKSFDALSKQADGSSEDICYNIAITLDTVGDTLHPAAFHLFTQFLEMQPDTLLLVVSSYQNAIRPLADAELLKQETL